MKSAIKFMNGSKRKDSNQIGINIQRQKITTIIISFLKYLERKNKMGWDFGWSSKQELIEYLVKPWDDGETQGRCLAFSVRGNVLWSVREVTDMTKERRSFINCDLLSCRCNKWGYKGMDEGMHPYQYSCPLKFLEF